jgi:hypothetical protein
MRAHRTSGLAYQRPAASARRQLCVMSLKLTGEGGAGINREPCEAICKSLATCFAWGRLRAARGPDGRDAAVLFCPRRPGPGRDVGQEVIVWREAEHIVHRASAPASARDFQVARTVRERFDHQPAGEAGQGTSCAAREREQVCVGYLVGREDAARVDVPPSSRLRSSDQKMRH